MVGILMKRYGFFNCAAAKNSATTIIIMNCIAEH